MHGFESVEECYMLVVAVVEPTVRPAYCHHYWSGARAHVLASRSESYLTVWSIALLGWEY